MGSNEIVWFTRFIIDSSVHVSFQKTSYETTQHCILFSLSNWWLWPQDIIPKSYLNISKETGAHKTQAPTTGTHNLKQFQTATKWRQGFLSSEKTPAATKHLLQQRFHNWASWIWAGPCYHGVNSTSWRDRSNDYILNHLKDQENLVFWMNH